MIAASSGAMPWIRDESTRRVADLGRRMARGVHQQSLHHVVAQSDWSDAAVLSAVRTATISDDRPNLIDPRSSADWALQA
jgi:hypothetical protein